MSANRLIAWFDADLVRPEEQESIRSASVM